MNDVVVYKNPSGDIKIGRIMGIPGQTIDFPESGGYTVNDYAQYEELPFETTIAETDIQFPLLLGENEYFVLNDYRSDQNDSRIQGAVEQNAILGTVNFIFRGRGF